MAIVGLIIGCNDKENWQFLTLEITAKKMENDCGNGGKWQIMNPKMMTKKVKDGFLHCWKRLLRVSKTVSQKVKNRLLQCRKHTFDKDGKADEKAVNNYPTGNQLFAKSRKIVHFLTENKPRHWKLSFSEAFCQVI